MPRSAWASATRTCFCSCSGKKSTMRLIVSGASIVCSVESTRWPVSAADRAARTVSMSRISPTRMTSGSWRIAARRAEVKSAVSWRISRWETIAFLSWCRISIGSSIVTMLTSRYVLMRSTIDGERRRLAGARRARDQHQPARLERELADHLGHVQVAERLRADRDAAEDEAVRAARLVGVDAEPAHARQRVREVGLVRLAELGDEVVGQDLLEHALGVGRLELGHLQLAQPAVDAHARGRAHLAVQVGAARAREGVQERDHGLGRLAHVRCIGAGIA